jgi:hypothetical protein
LTGTAAGFEDETRRGNQNAVGGHLMPTKLDRPLKRELKVNGKAYVLTISPEGLKLVPKGKRKGQELAWKDLVSGQAALAVALNASLERVRR